MPDTPIQTARSRGGYATCSAFAVVSVEGADAAGFLDAQLPCDLAAISPHTGVPTVRLERRGRIQCLLLLVPVEGGYWLLALKESASALAEDLERFHIREQVQIRVRSDLVVWDFTGEGLPDKLGGALDTKIRWEDGTRTSFDLKGRAVNLIAHAWAGETGCHLVFQQEGEGEVRDALHSPLSGFQELAPEDLEILLMEGGWPRVSDLGPKALTAEFENEDTWVSFNKGCYLGQETVARVHSRGNPQRRFMGLVGDGPSPFPSGSLVMSQGAAVGEVIQSKWSPSLDGVMAYAWIKHLFSEPESTVHVEDAGKLRPATVKSLPFYRRPGVLEEGARLRKKGLQAFQKDHFEEALSLFNRATLLNPLDVDAYEAMGVCYERMGRLEHAIRVMEELRDMAPDHAMAWTNLSRYYAHQGRIEEAEEAKGKATYLGWKKAMGESQAQAKAEEQAQVEEARARERIELFRQVLELDEEDVVANFGLGKLYLDRGQFDLAEPLLAKAIRFKESYSMAYNHLATCLVAQERRQEALKVLEKGIEVAARQGDLMPKREMERRLLELNSNS